jgi:hypothetical protein
LPYNERRKYMEQKQQQQQQMQRQQQYPQQFPPPGMMTPQLFAQSPGMQQQPYSPPPYATFMGDPSQQMPAYGIPTQQPMHVPYMMGVPPPMQPNFGGPAANAPMQPTKQQPTSSTNAARKERSKGSAAPSTDPRRKSAHHSLPPSGHARTMSGNAGGTFV